MSCKLCERNIANAGVVGPAPCQQSNERCIITGAKKSFYCIQVSYIRKHCCETPRERDELRNFN
jgi:hypothetical protein